MSVSNLVSQNVSYPDLVSRGQFQCNNNTPVVIQCNFAIANRIIISPASTASATSANQPSIVALTPGTSFSVNCGGANTNFYNYVVLA